MKRESTSYTNTARFLHWLIAFIFILVWCIGFITIHVHNPDGGRYFAHGIRLHKNIASSLILLILIRISWRLTHPIPKFPHIFSSKQQIIRHLAHLMLYLTLIILPLSGCLVSWSSGHKVSMFYCFDLPNLISPNPRLLFWSKLVHIYISWLAGLLVVMHVGMSFIHHWIKKDNLLRNMLEIRKK